MFVDLAKKRRKAFDHLDSYLARIKKVALAEDENSKVYLFGSVAEGNFNMASDIDILIVTEKDKGSLLTKLDKEEIGFPFEMHVRNVREAEPYFRHVHKMKEL
jgi:hypothetical protein